jgi:hypothetical protein
LGKFLTVVALSRGVRYTAIGLLTDRYGSHFIRVVRHPTQHWGWSLLFTGAILALVGAGILFNKRLLAAPAR